MKSSLFDRTSLPLLLFPIPFLAVFAFLYMYRNERLQFSIKFGISSSTLFYNLESSWMKNMKGEQIKINE
jgi:hypothetical protein